MLAVTREEHRGLHIRALGELLCGVVLRADTLLARAPDEQGGDVDDAGRRPSQALRHEV